MSVPETRLYGLERFEDDLSQGYRLFDTTDQVWEARDHGTAESRIYEDRFGTWYAAVRTPETDDEAAWEDFSSLAERIEEEYKIDLSLNQREFHRLIEGRRSAPERDDTTLTYNDESMIDLPTNDLDRTLGLVLLEASYFAKGTGSGLTLGTTAGAATGFLAGSPGGPAGAAAGAALGGLFGGTIGTVGAVKKRIDDQFEPYGFVSEKNREKKKRQWTEKVNEWREKWIRRKDTPDEDLLEDINRRNTLQYILKKSAYDRELNQELDELEERDLDRQRELLMDITFHEFDGHPGVIASRRAETYEEAVTFVQTCLDTGSGTPDKPTLYRSEDAFQQIFDHLVHEDRLTNDAERLVKNLYHEDRADQTIMDWVSDRYDLTDSLEQELLP
ncbi:MAG: hypothetical protein SVU32_06380 [Candidatus Nanohaloarchaea archaeon]|nr:hypothetical protein [Candidatus Nanohaloarchaea archaeon]